MTILLALFLYTTTVVFVRWADERLPDDDPAPLWALVLTATPCYLVIAGLRGFAIAEVWNYALVPTLPAMTIVQAGAAALIITIVKGGPR